ncbi:MAG: tripartite tricarboxylate transporter substrate binding protein [Sulfuricaulis sp.]|nr:tripartite tricarboxylate transporter substrate binding protein [Sulfuricaulis sp.]
MKTFHLSIQTVIGSVLCLLLLIPLAVRAEYPDKPIRIVVPYPPGGGTDVVARILAQRLGDKLGQSVIVENRSGAGGTVGTTAVAKSAPDGYTLLLGQTGPNTIAPSLYSNLAYDAENDFAPITGVISMPLFLVVPGNSAFKSLGDLLAAGKQSKDFNYASAGNGTLGHLSAELLNMLAGTKFVLIPYRGSAPAIMALLAGEASMHFASGVDALPLMKQGRLRALAVASERRTQLAPDVPTAAEAGLGGLEANLWYGLLAPAKTPRAIIDRLHREVAAILGEPATRARLLELSAEAAPSTPEELAALIKADAAKYAKVVKAAGVKVE